MNLLNSAANAKASSSISEDSCSCKSNNQITNGPLNAHLLSGHSISINHTKPD